LGGCFGYIGGTEPEKDNNPLPQAGRTPDDRGIADDQSEGVTVSENWTKVEHRSRLPAGRWICPRQCGLRNNDSGGIEDSIVDESAAPAEERSDPAEKRTTAMRRW
jgi:hypothetical protein